MRSDGQFCLLTWLESYAKRAALGAGGAVLMVHALNLVDFAVYTSGVSCSKDSDGRASAAFTITSYHSLLRKWH